MRETVQVSLPDHHLTCVPRLSHAGFCSVRIFRQTGICFREMSIPLSGFSISGSLTLISLITIVIRHKNDPNVVLGSYVVASSRGVTSKSHVNVVRYFVSWKFLESVRQGLMWCHASNRLQFFKFFPSTFLTKIIFPLFSSRGTNGGGISVTQSSGSPYLHGRPRFPVQQPQHQTQTPSGMGMQVQYPQYTFSTGGGAPTGATSSQQHHHHQQQQLELQQLQLQQQQLMNGQGGYLQQQGMSNNGFTPVSLSVPVSSGGMVSMQQQSLPVQAIRPIQPVQVLYNKTLHVVNPKPKV